MVSQVCKYLVFQAMYQNANHTFNILPHFIFSASLLFLSVALFGSQCWNRDWLLYPNYNYVSWSYALALFACVSHIVATFFLSKDARSAKERKTKNKALLARIKPNLYMKTFSDFASRSSRSNIGSGYL